MSALDMSTDFHLRDRLNQMLASWKRKCVEFLSQFQERMCILTSRLILKVGYCMYGMLPIDTNIINCLICNPYVLITSVMDLGSIVCDISHLTALSPRKSTTLHGGQISKVQASCVEVNAIMNQIDNCHNVALCSALIWYGKDWLVQHQIWPNYRCMFY